MLEFETHCTVELASQTFAFATKSVYVLHSVPQSAPPAPDVAPAPPDGFAPALPPPLVLPETPTTPPALIPPAIPVLPPLIKPPMLTSPPELTAPPELVEPPRPVLPAVPCLPP